MSLLLNYAPNPITLHERMIDALPEEPAVLTGSSPGPPGAASVLTPLPSPCPDKDNPVSVMGYVYPNLLNLDAAVGGLQDQIDALSPVPPSPSGEPGILPSGTLSYNLAIPLTVNPTSIGNLTWLFSQSQAPASGARGVFFDRPALEHSPQSIDLGIGGQRAWGTVALDFDHTTSPFPDLILAYAYGTGDPGDNFRMSQRTYANGGVKFIFGGEKIGSPVNEGTVITAVSPTGSSSPVGGFAARLFNGAPLLKGVCRSTGSYNVLVNFHDLAVLAHDWNQNQGQDIRFRDIDPSHTTPSGIEKNRLFIRFPNAHQGAVGLNTEQPQAMLDVRGYFTGDATPTVNNYLSTAYQDSALNNRSINLQSVVNSVGVHNFVMLSGSLGAAATVAAPVLSSSFKHALGLWADCEGNVGHLTAAPNGLNQTPVRAISWGQNAGNARISFFGAALAGQQALAAAATDPASTQALANSIRTALIALGLGV